MTGLSRARSAALYVIAALVLASSLVSFAQSYRGLLDWAAGHSVPPPWSWLWPLMVDVFIAVGELALFVALVDRVPLRRHWPAWVSIGVGLLVSAAGNVGHIRSHALADRATAAVPPLAATAALFIGLGVLKWAVAVRPGAAAPVAVAGAGPASIPVFVAAASGASGPASGGASVPSLRRIQREVGVGAPKARQVRELIRASVNGHGPREDVTT